MPSPHQKRDRSFWWLLDERKGKKSAVQTTINKAARQTLHSLHSTCISNHITSTTSYHLASFSTTSYHLFLFLFLSAAHRNAPQPAKMSGMQPPTARPSSALALPFVILYDLGLLFLFLFPRYELAQSAC